MNEKAQRLFVYGTLMPGRSNHDQIEDMSKLPNRVLLRASLLILERFPPSSPVLES